MGKQRYQRPKLELTQSRAHLVLSKMLINTEISMQPVDEETDVDTDDDWEDDAVNGGKKTDKDIMLDTPISFDYLFETSSNNFVKDIESNEINIDMEIFEYMGSLTTPPYTEGVQWMVSKKTHFIEKKQLKKLSACWGNMNNARECQDYCGRTVQLRSQIYADNFCDGIEELNSTFKAAGADVIGYVDAGSYNHSESKSDQGGKFLGCPFDEDNQGEMSEDRAKEWVEQLKSEGMPL